MVPTYTISIKLIPKSTKVNREIAFHIPLLHIGQLNALHNLKIKNDHKTKTRKRPTTLLLN